MKRLPLFLGLLLCLPLSAHADDASKRTKVVELFSLIHVDRVLTQVKDDIMHQTASVTAKVDGPNPTPEQKTQIEGLQQKISALLDDQLGWQAMEPAYISLYAQTYSEEELDAILAFYKSPAGIALIAKSPDLTNRSMLLIQAKMVTIEPELRQLVQTFINGAAPPATTPRPAPSLGPVQSAPASPAPAQPVPAQPTPEKSTPK